MFLSYLGTDFLDGEVFLLSSDGSSSMIVVTFFFGCSLRCLRFRLYTLGGFESSAGNVDYYLGTNSDNFVWNFTVTFEDKSVGLMRN